MTVAAALAAAACTIAFALTGAQLAADAMHVPDQPTMRPCAVEDR